MRWQGQTGLKQEVGNTVGMEGLGKEPSHFLKGCAAGTGQNALTLIPAQGQEGMAMPTLEPCTDKARGQLTHPRHTAQVLRLLKVWEEHSWHTGETWPRGPNAVANPVPHPTLPVAASNAPLPSSVSLLLRNSTPENRRKEDPLTFPPTEQRLFLQVQPKTSVNR